VQGSASSLSSGDTSRHIIYCSINTSSLSWWAWAWVQVLVDGVVTKNPIGDFLFGRTNRKTRMHVLQILKFSLLGCASKKSIFNAEF